MLSAALRRCCSVAVASTTFWQKTLQQQQQGRNNRVGRRLLSSNAGGKNEPSASGLFLTAGLPLVLFSLTAAWVLKNGLEGKTREYEAYRGQVTK